MAPTPVRLGHDAVDRLTVDHPAYDRSRITPGIVHFGLGAAHRAHQAAYLDALMNEGSAHDFGIVGVETDPDGKPLVEALASQDGLYTLLLDAPGASTRAHVVGSIVRVLHAPSDPQRVLEILTDPAIRIVSLTLGTGGYPVDEDTGAFDPQHPTVRADGEEGGVPRSALAFVVDALARRHAAGVAPFTVVSCDDLPGNGDITRRMATALARIRIPDLADHVDQEVRFPNSTVDVAPRIVTRDEIDRMHSDLGLVDACPVAADEHIAWALEDDFPAGRPPFEQAGVRLTDNVVPFGLFKLRLQESSRQAACFLGYLAGHRRARDVADDEQLMDFLWQYLQLEVVPTLPAAPGLDAQSACHTLVAGLRAAWGDEPLHERCADGSDRIPLWLVPVIEDNVRARVPVVRAALILASWARYVEGVDEQGAPIEVIDPLREPLAAATAQQRSDPLVLLRNPMLFGGLIDTPEFVEPYRAALDSLHTRGARATLASLMEQAETIDGRGDR